MPLENSAFFLDESLELGASFMPPTVNTHFQRILRVMVSHIEEYIESIVF